jgi:hypothetical protein
METDAKIKAKILEDGTNQIIIEKVFDQNICSNMGW